MAKSSEIVSLKIRCGEHHIDVPFDDVQIDSFEQECELCGSHGSVEIEIQTCPNCKKDHSFTLREW